jgi:lysophospholipase-3
MARILRVVAPLLLPAGLRELISPATIDHRPPEGAADGEVLLHPLVLVPGLTCSELEAWLTDAYRPSVPRCGAMKGKGWFGLWANCSDLPAHHYVQCFIEQMSLVYDPATNDYRNLPGVETRVRGFGSSQGFQRNPEHTTWCFEVLRHELEKAGYRDGNTPLRPAGARLVVGGRPPRRQHTCWRW